MADYEATVKTLAGVTTLALTTANGYRLREMTLPIVSRRRDVVASPDMDGDVELQSVLDGAVLEMLVTCTGTNDPAAWTAYDNLYSAVCGATRRFLMVTTMRGYTKTWTSGRATDWRLTSNAALLRQRHLEVAFRLPVYPVPA